MNKHQKKNRRMKHKQTPTTPTPRSHEVEVDIRRRHFDPVTATPDGSLIWRDYGNPRRIIVTKRGESPLDVIAMDHKYTLCACGCGRPVPEKGAFVEGHKERMEHT